jgi:hypothetical protein
MCLQKTTLKLPSASETQAFPIPRTFVPLTAAKQEVEAANLCIKYEQQHEHLSRCTLPATQLPNF